MGVSEPKYKADFSKGDIVKIIDGPFATHEGVVDEFIQKRENYGCLSLFRTRDSMELFPSGTEEITFSFHAHSFVAFGFFQDSACHGFSGNYGASWNV